LDAACLRQAVSPLAPAAERSPIETTETRMKALLVEEAHREWFDEVCGARPHASVTVVLTLHNLLGQYDNDRRRSPALETFLPRIMESFNP